MSVRKEVIVPEQPQYIPYLKITPSYICGYYHYEGVKRKIWQKHVFKGKDLFSDQMNKESQLKVYTGEITKGSKKRLKKCCELLFAISKKKRVKSPKTGKEFSFRIGLITLTLSASQGEFTDRDIKKRLLEPFLRHFRGKGLKNYIWKSERQWNGNVHFHILTDAYIHYQEIRDYWNKLQSQLGFIEIFHSNHGHRNPNSTDVKSVIDESGMAKYMFKYMLKGEDEEKKKALQDQIDQSDIGKIWDCSLNLKLPNDTADVLEDWQYDLMEEKINNDIFVELKSDHFKVWIPKSIKMSKAAPKFLLNRLLAYLEKVRSFERPLASEM